MPVNTAERDKALAQQNQAWDLRTQGWSERRIAAEMKISAATVCRLLKRARTRALKELTGKVEEMKAEQTAQIDHIIDESLQAWERSKDDAEKVRTKSMGAKDGGAKDGGAKDKPVLQIQRGEKGLDVKVPEERPGMYLGEDGEEVDEDTRAKLLSAVGMNPDGSAMTIVERTEEVKGQVGDSRYLKVALDALGAKRDIWGLDAPKAEAGAIPVVVKVYQGISVEDLVKTNDSSASV